MTTGKMKKIFFICLTLAALVACKEKPQQKPNGDIAGKAAVEYYGYLQRITSLPMLMACITRNPYLRSIRLCW